jgi:transposase
MAHALRVVVKEEIQELKKLQKKHPLSSSKLQMLILIKGGIIVSKDALAQALSVSTNSVHKWRTNYIAGGMDLLLKDNRGGKRKGKITAEAQLKLQERLNNSREGFGSFIEIQQWLKDNFNIEMGYHAVNKYVKRNFKAKPKVGRKSHINKDPAAEAVFKKTASGARTY